MPFEIVQSTPNLLGISLDEPFPLGFGTLDRLPRVIYTIRASDGHRHVEGIGEASIDFPFSDYDAWDIYYSLLTLDLRGKDVNSREEILSDREVQETILFQYPAAFAALNMALDDLFGKVNNISVLDIYGRKRRGGKALASISFKRDISALVDEIESEIKRGFIPKLKMGQDLESDLAMLLGIGDHLQEHPSSFSYALDFNAQYQVEEFKELISRITTLGYHLQGALLLEQPTRRQDAIDGLIVIRHYLNKKGIPVGLLADEAFLTLEDAINCTKNGILLNFKIQKIGGAYQASLIEKELASIIKHEGFSTMVGGTFPTAIGRTYDQQCAATLRYASLPSDGWEPSTDWFTNSKHLIKERFAFDEQDGIFLPFEGPGLGITPDWGKIKAFVIENPRDEYMAIRQGRAGDKIAIRLRRGEDYREIYESLSGRSWDWNLK